MGLVRTLAGSFFIDFYIYGNKFKTIIYRVEYYIQTIIIIQTLFISYEKKNTNLFYIYLEKIFG